MRQHWVKRGRRWWPAGAVVVLILVTGGYVRQRILPFRGLAVSPARQVIQRLGGGSGVSAADGRWLHDEVVRRQYRRGLEVGTGEGYSALWLGTAFQRTGGSLVTLEIDPGAAEAARRNLDEAGLGEVVEVRASDALQEIPRLAGDFDFAFLDVGVPINQQLFDLIYPRIRPGGAILAHNAELFRWQQPGFLKAITRNPDLETRFTGVIRRMSLSVKRQTP